MASTRDHSSHSILLPPNQFPFPSPWPQFPCTFAASWTDWSVQTWSEWRMWRATATHRSASRLCPLIDRSADRNAHFISPSSILRALFFFHLPFDGNRLLIRCSFRQALLRSSLKQKMFDKRVKISREIQSFAFKKWEEQT